MDRVTLTEFVGAPSATAWSRVESLRVSEVENSYIAFSVAGVDAGSIGREIVAHLRAERPSSFESLYELLVNLDRLVRDRHAKLSFAAGFIGLVECGWISLNGAVSLRRDDKFGTIVSGQQLAIKAGRKSEDDLYVLTTAGGAGLADEVRVLKERGYKLDGVVSTLGRLLPTHPQADQTAMCLLHVGSEITESDESGAAFPGMVAPISDDTNAESTLLPEKPVDGTSFKPRRLDLEEDPKPPFTKVGDSRSTVADQAKSVGRVLLPLLKKAGVGLLAGITHVGSRLLSLMKVSGKMFDKSAVEQHSMSEGGDNSYKRKLSAKKVVVMVATGIGLLLLALVIVSGFIMWRRGIRDQAVAFVQPHNGRFEQAVQLARLDPIRGRDQLKSLIEELRTLQAESKPGSEQRKAVEEMLQKAEGKFEEMVGSEALAIVPVWLDLQDQAQGFVANKVSSKPGFMLIADTAQQKAFLIDVRQKLTTPIDLSEAPVATDVELRSDDELITLGGGIQSIPIPSGDVSTLAEEGDSNRAGNLISSFDNYIYVFNPTIRRIYRYVDQNGELSTPANWLASPLGFQAEDVYDMAVDGDLWLTTKTGELRKFTSGRATSFAISELPESLAGPLSIVTSADQTYMYLFVPNQGRVVVLSKDGVFVRQIKSNALAGATAIAVDEEQNQLYIVSGSVVYQVAILQQN